VNNPINYEHVRSKIEARLAPILRLHRRRNWFFAHVVIFMMLNLTFWSWSSGPGYYSSQETGYYYLPDGGFGPQTFTVWHQQPLFLAATFCWFLVLIFQAFNIWGAFRREKMIQREIGQEMQLEKLSLMAELSRQQGSIIPEEMLEKPKRGIGLDNDGELFSSDEENEAVLSQARNHRHG